MNAENLSPEDVAVLSKCPAPRVFAFNGTALNTMDSFSRFLAGMGYPESALKDPRTGALSRSGYADAGKTAEEIRRVYETEGLRPVPIGHSRGGALVMKTLHELKGMKLGFAAAVATGKWMRVFGQWDTLSILRSVPDGVEEFAGYRLAGDWIGSDIPFLREPDDYAAAGTARVRNMTLAGASHVGITNIEALSREPVSRARIEAYRPSEAAPAANARLMFASDIWYHVKKHWCLELQRIIRERRQTPDAEPNIA